MIGKILKPFVEHLDPADSLSEIIYGLIMVLSITLTASYYVEGSPNPAKALMVAAIGCNVAWGLIDGVMYVVTSMYERGTSNRLIQMVRDATSKEGAMSAIQDHISSSVGKLLSPKELNIVSLGVYEMAQDAQPEEVHASREDMMGAIACFLLNFTATFPASISFILIEDWNLALRVSGVVTIIMLFLVGYRWARYANADPMRVGFTVSILGVILVLIAIALGG